MPRPAETTHQGVAVPSGPSQSVAPAALVGYTPADPATGDAVSLPSPGSHAPVRSGVQPSQSCSAPDPPDSAPIRAEGEWANSLGRGPVWGTAGVRAFPVGSRVAPNGVGYHPLFAYDLDINVWLLRDAGLYGFSDGQFWAQKAAPGITNPSQGAFDFSKREYDLNAGLAWNGYGPFEARAFAYSFNNLNRGYSDTTPSGYKDGAGLEARWYVGDSYPARPGAPFDVARAPFVSVGYYPTKEMVDAEGAGFAPGPSGRAYLTRDVWADRAYLYLDAGCVGDRSFRLRIVSADGGVAVRPDRRAPGAEIRLGTDSRYDVQAHEWVASLYCGARIVY